MAILLDTSILIAIERGTKGVLRDDEEAAIAAITASELLHGVHRAGRSQRPVREAFVEQLLASIPVVPFTLTIARVHARLWSDLLVRGRPVGAHDLLIAATAVAMGWPLATLERAGFSDVPGLRLVDVA